jgi:hypothetical protein
MPTAASRLSSFFTNRLRAALWIVVLAGVIALVVAVVVGLRPHHAAASSTRRTIVAAYIIRVGRIQIGLAAQVRAIDKEYKQFAHNPANLGKRIAQYRRAEQTLTLLRGRLATVDPPREARKLHSLLLRLAGQDVLVAAAVTGLAAYLPRLAREQAPLGPALLGLRAAIAKAHSAKTQAAAFAAYSATTAAVAARITVISAPSFFDAARNAEVTQLHQLSSLSAKIADALSHKRLAAAQKLVAALGGLESDTAVVRAQRAGALAYDARVHRLQALATQIETARRRLEKNLPH